MRRRHAAGGLHLRVELADGVRLQVPAGWTTLDPVGPDFVPLRGRLHDMLALADLVESMEARGGVTGGDGTDAAGVAGADRSVDGISGGRTAPVTELARLMVRVAAEGSDVNGRGKIKARHLDRIAVACVRQSSARQVLENRESTGRQHSLRDHALALGWPSERVVTIDADLGVSGSTISARSAWFRWPRMTGRWRAR